MNKHVSIALGVALFGLPVFAMAADFSGTWVRDNAKSEAVPGLMWTTREAQGRGGGGRGRGGNGPEITMTVKQTSNSMEVNESQGGQTNYMLGKPATNSIDTLLQKETVTAQMQGDNFVVETTRPYGGMPGNVTLNIKEVWSLSPDGKVLTVTTTQTSPAITKTVKQVYNKK